MPTPIENNTTELQALLDQVNELPGEVDPTGGLANVTVDTASDTVTIELPIDIAGKDILCLGTGTQMMYASGIKTMDYFVIMIVDGALFRAGRIDYNGTVPYLNQSNFAALSGNNIVLTGVSSDYSSYITYTIWAEIQWN